MSTAVSLASAQRANQVKDTAKLFFVDLPPECQEIAFQHLANTYEEKSLAALEQTAVVPSKVARPFLYPTMTWLDKVVKTRKQVALEKKQLEVFVSSKKRELIKHLYCSSEHRAVELYASLAASFDAISSGKNPNTHVSTSAWENGGAVTRLWHEGGNESIFRWVPEVVERLAYLKGGFNVQNPPRRLEGHLMTSSRAAVREHPCDLGTPPPRTSVPRSSGVPDTPPIQPRAYRLGKPAASAALDAASPPTLRSSRAPPTTPPSPTPRNRGPLASAATVAGPAAQALAVTPPRAPPPLHRPSSTCKSLA